MPKSWLALFLLLAACTTTNPPQTGLPSPEADPSAPGMIPMECEALLQKSEGWGYQPSGKWKPASREQALEVLAFFETFPLVPAKSSDFFRAFSELNLPGDEASRQALFEQTGKAQVCDFTLTSLFLTELARYPWAKGDRANVGKAFLRFALNQQAKAMPVLPRMASIQIYAAAVKARLVSGDHNAIMGLGKEAERAISKTKTIDQGATQAEWLASFQEEVKASEKLREKLARMLPLP